MNQLHRELVGKAKIYKVNVDEEPELASRFGIRGIPTVMSFEKGRTKQELVGVR